MSGIQSPLKGASHPRVRPGIDALPPNRATESQAQSAVWSEEGALEAAESALAQEVDGEADLSEAMASIGLQLSGQIKEKLDKEDQKHAKFARYRRALRKLSHKQYPDAQIDQWADALQKSESPEAFLQSLETEGLSRGERLLLISELLDRGSELPTHKRRALQQRQEEQLSGPDWALEVCAATQVGRLTEPELIQLKHVYQIAQQEVQSQEGLAHWFEEIQHWDRRSDKVKTLMRSLALGISVETHRDAQVKLAANLEDLSKLHLFLGIEQQATEMDHAFQFPQDTTLEELLHSLDQPWIYGGWLNDRAKQLGIQEKQNPYYFSYLKEIVELMPEACFRDQTQKEQLLQAIQENQLPHEGHEEGVEPTELPNLDPSQLDKFFK